MTIDINKIITKPWRGNSNGSLVILIPKSIAEKTQITTSSTIKKLDLERLV